MMSPRLRLKALLTWVVLQGASLSLSLLGFDRTSRLAYYRPLRLTVSRAAHVQLMETVRLLGIVKEWHLRLTPDDCLPVALAGVFMLRQQGGDAQLMLGVKRYPFTAHAWIALGTDAIDFPPDKYKDFIAINMARKVT